MTVIVIGPKEVGIPVASLITNVEDTKTLTCFFEAIKARVSPQTSFQLFMSDDSKVYFPAFMKVFNCEKKLLCSFHFVRSWRRYLRGICKCLFPEMSKIQRDVIIDRIVRLTRTVAQSCDDFHERERENGGAYRGM